MQKFSSIFLHIGAAKSTPIIDDQEFEFELN